MAQTTSNNISIRLLTVIGLMAVGCAGGNTVRNDGGVDGKKDNKLDYVPPPDTITLTCGNGVVDFGEKCDDTNTINGDGCNKICQVEADFECPPEGGTCTYTAQCGDAKLATNEQCDDGNTDSGDGCTADCQGVEAGWECRVPGKKCVPSCGDSQKIGTEMCDDGNRDDGDGCSATCLIEPGYSCDAEGKNCTHPTCGDGIPEGPIEACDKGADNGLFYGDGSGCSKTCTTEPVCRDASGKNIACTATCGDGNIDSGEECDDGNKVARDGCSVTCTVETGFTCTPQTIPDSSPCKDNPTAQCLYLPVVFRDFKPENQAGGHPDFFYMGTKKAPSTTITTWCVPNSGGPAKKGDSTDRCWDMVKPDLVNGKPVFNAARPTGTQCTCQFTDWSYKTNGAHVPSYTYAMSPLIDKVNLEPNSINWNSQPYADGLPSWKGLARIVTDATSFSQWYTDNTYNTKVTGVIELGSIGANQFQFSSGSNKINQGFFPLDAVATTEPKLCNLWPYWYPFPSCTGDQYLLPTEWPAIDPVAHPTGDWVVGLAGKSHNAWFTTEARYLFAYEPAANMTLQFYGDDDLWIFINGKLVVDLGGVHQRLPGRVTVTGATGTATITEGGDLTATGAVSACAEPATGGPNCRQRTVDLGLEPGKIYEVAVFHADRHPVESNYQLTLSSFSTKRSTCTPFCGDGVVTAGEECDFGNTPGIDPTLINDDNAYGGCTTKCKWGPYCGDQIVNGPEQCDDGRDNGKGYGLTGCTSACTTPHYCGDGVIDTANGEQCDDGDGNNGTSNSLCSTLCQLSIG